MDIWVMRQWRAGQLRRRDPLVGAVQQEQAGRSDLDLVQMPEPEHRVVPHLAAVDARTVQAPQLLDRADRAPRRGPGSVAC